MFNGQPCIDKDIIILITFHGTSIYQYDFYTVELMAYRTNIIAGVIKLNAHADTAWAEPENLGGFEFAPADIPFVEMIRRGEIEL
jgi:8-oxo-dGTP diphosphatase